MMSLHLIILIFLFLGPPDLKARASVFKVILQDIEKEIGFDYNACAMMTDGYTPSDISALCGAAINSLLTERKLEQQKDKKREKEKNNSAKSDSSSSSSSRNGPKMARISSKQLGVEVNILIFISLFLYFFFSSFCLFYPFCSTSILHTFFAPLCIF